LSRGGGGPSELLLDAYDALPARCADRAAWSHWAEMTRPDVDMRPENLDRLKAQHQAVIEKQTDAAAFATGEYGQLPLEQREAIVLSNESDLGVLYHGDRPLKVYAVVVDSGAPTTHRRLHRGRSPRRAPRRARRSSVSRAGPDDGPPGPPEGRPGRHAVQIGRVS
jgi:hypothetical protein